MRTILQFRSDKNLRILSIRNAYFFLRGHNNSKSQRRAYYCCCHGILRNKTIAIKKVKVKGTQNDITLREEHSVQSLLSMCESVPRLISGSYRNLLIL